jgi:hypothetical protein
MIASPVGIAWVMREGRRLPPANEQNDQSLF